MQAETALVKSHYRKTITQSMDHTMSAATLLQHAKREIQLHGGDTF